MNEPTVGWITDPGTIRFDWADRFRRYYDLDDGPQIGIRARRFQATVALTDAGVKWCENAERDAADRMGRANGAG